MLSISSVCHHLIKLQKPIAVWIVCTFKSRCMIVSKVDFASPFPPGKA